DRARVGGTSAVLHRDAGGVVAGDGGDVDPDDRGFTAGIPGFNPEVEPVECDVVTVGVGVIEVEVGVGEVDAYRPVALSVTASVVNGDGAFVSRRWSTAAPTLRCSV